MIPKTEIANPEKVLAFALLSGALVGCQREGAKPTAPAPEPSPAPPEEGIPLSQLSPAPPRQPAQPPLLIPRPKEATFPDAFFPLLPSTRIAIAGNASEQDRRAVAALQTEAQRLFGRTWEVVAATPGLALSNTILLQGSLPNPLLQERQTRPELPEKLEGYALEVRDNQVAVVGRDAPGLLWGVQSLRQLLDPVRKGFRGARLRDWPDFPLRGVHLFHGNHALPFHQKLIDRVLSPLKLNSLFLEVEQVRWNRDPKIAPSWAGTTEQLAEELTFARARGVSVYPLLQSFGHMGWLLDNAQNRNLAEDPATPYALCMTDPKALSYLEGFLAEADALFGAPVFHLGLDEVRLKGRFPYRSRPLPATELFLKGVRHWHDFFARRGKPVCLWADMALHAPEVSPAFGTAPSAAEAARLRAGLPKDLWLADWQYGEFSDFPSLRQLKNAGFGSLLAATWYRPKNIPALSAAAAKVGAKGMIQTTWCGYESHEGVLQTEEKRQFVAFVRAAEHFWNGGRWAESALPYDPAAVFDRLYRG